MTLPALHAVTRGSGRPLLVLHGIGVDHRMMEPIVEPISDDVELERHYVDLPGHGETPGDGVNSTGDVVDAVERWIDDALGERPFLLLAFSYGGMIARELVRRRPEQIEGLALLAPAVQPDEDRRTTPPSQVLQRDDDLIAELDDKTRAQFTEATVVQTRAQFERFEKELLPGLLAADGDTIKRLQAHYPLGHEVETAEWDRPTTIICGRQDSMVGWQDHLDLLPYYPRASYAVLDGAGHYVHFERPEAVEALLREWLRICARGDAAE